MEQVILVDKKDNAVGLMEKLAAHKGQGVLHRAVSVLLYRKKNGKTEVLLQQRSKAKPLWPLFWSNTVCTHPRDGELPLECAVRRLKEEMGIIVEGKDLFVASPMVYRAKYNDAFSENEFDHVIFGWWNGEPQLNKEEVTSCKWVDWDETKREAVHSKERYTPWFMNLLKNFIGIPIIDNI